MPSTLESPPIIDVLHLIDSLAAGGAQELLKLLIKKSASGEIRHTVVAINAHKSHYEKEIRAAGAEVLYMTDSSHIPLLLNLPFSIWRCRRLLRERGPHILHMHLEGSMVVGTLSSAGLDVKRVLGTYACKEQLPFWVCPWLRWFESSFDKIQCAREFDGSWLPRDPAARVEAGPGLDLEEGPSVNSGALVREFNLAGRGPFLFSVGRFHPDKRHDLAIRALPIVKKAFPKAVLFVIGAGEAGIENELRQMAEGPETSDSVIFTGNRKDLSSFFNLGGFFLRTSLNECGNMTNLLAQRFGLVCIGFDVSPVVGTRMDFISPGSTGSLVPLGDHLKMAEEIIRIGKDRRAYEGISMNSRRFIKEERDIEHTFVRPFQEAYRELAGQGRNAACR